mgnify:CR=1 FL=1
MNNLLKNSGIKLTFREFLKVYVDNYFEIRKAFDFDNLSNTSEFEDFLKTQNSFLVKFLKFNNDNLIPECKRRLNILHIITHL